MNSTLKKVLLWTAWIVSVWIVLLIIGGIYLGWFVWTWINNPSNQIWVDSIISQVNTLEQQAEWINLAWLRDLVTQSQQIINNTTWVVQPQWSGVIMQQPNISAAILLIDAYKSQIASGQAVSLSQLQQLEWLLMDRQPSLTQ